ncbi:Septation ring formation regulator EzrA [Streptococcus pneumoniae]|nr:Septation ring formation regulator EzrA [Streptococcus pneumoniae]
MSNGQLIYLMVAIAVILVLAYVVAIFLRKRNEGRLEALEERKEELYNLPVNDEVEAVKNMHLIGQSQVAFREWNQKWVDLSLNSFADIENNLFEAESYNHSFRFLKASHQIDQIESQITLIEEDIAAIRNALADLEKNKNLKIVVVFFMLWIYLRNFSIELLKIQNSMVKPWMKLKNN